MDALDRHVKPWIFSPDEQATYDACHPSSVRRYAIKVAVMRSLVDFSDAISHDHCRRLFKGEDLEQWRVFVARAHLKELRHTCAGWGSRSQPGAELNRGFIHVSWALGTTVFMALHSAGTGDRDFALLLLEYNRARGEPFAEIPIGAVSMPDVFGHPKLPAGQTEPFFLFLTPDRVSPVSDRMRRLYEATAPLTGARNL